MLPKNPAPLTQKQIFMAKQVMDIRPGKGMTLSQSNEHLRVSLHGAKTSSRSLNIDPTRDLLNFEITQGCQVVPVDKRTSIPKRIRENLKKRGIEDPNKKYKKLGLEPKIRTVANFILGGSRDQMHRLAFGNQKVNLERGADNSSIRRMPEIENWAKDMYRFMSDRFGEKNIAAFVVHLDETNPHIHCTVLPITEQNKFSWKQVMVGENNSKFEYQKRTTELHNAIAEINAKYGLERGDPIAETGAKHRSTAEYHEALRKELKEQNKRLFDTKIVLDDAIEKNKETIKEQKQTIDSLNKEIKHASARVKGLSTMIEHLETYKEDLEKEIAKLKADRDSGKISAEEAARKMDAITKNLEDVKAQILDKESKLSVAQAKLDSLNAQTSKTETRYQEVKTKLQTAQPEYNKNAMQEMEAFGYNLAAFDAMKRMEKYNEMTANMSPDERRILDKYNSVLLDDSIFEQMAENATEITTVATALFLGYLDKATAIAESHGGGSGPGTGWGKKDDEDELAFKHRCMLMAMHMMRPQNKVKKSRWHR